MSKSEKLSVHKDTSSRIFTFGVCGTSDPRITPDDRRRCTNIIRMVGDAIARDTRMPDGSDVRVVWSDVLIDTEKQADLVARQFADAGVKAIVCAPDTWAFPQLTLMSLLSHFPDDMPVNITCGNSGPRPGVVYAHATNGALAQSGRLVALNVGSWPDKGLAPVMTSATADALVDWCYSALAYAGLKGRRVVVFGHDSMGMETALAHVIPTRNTFGLEITRLDMKLLADMLEKKAYDKAEHRALRAWFDRHIGKRIEIPSPADDKKFDQCLGMYLIARDLLVDLDAVGGGFMSQLEWGSDKRGKLLPVGDPMESLFNTTFDHNGRKPPTPFATEADVQGLLTMLFMTWLSGGQPPLFMDFRKVWEPREVKALARKLKVRASAVDDWARRGFVDGVNSGAAALDWAGKPNTKPETLLKRVSMPKAQYDYWPGGGNSISFLSPGGIEGLAARLAYSGLSGMWSMVWDQALTVDVPAKLAKAVTGLASPNWPHTFILPRYATMAEYKQYPPANHFHMTWNLKPARLQHWMDLANVLSVAPWVNRPRFVEGVDRPSPLLHLINGGEDNAKMLRAR